MNDYTAGNLIRITVAFTAVLNTALIDPTTVILNLKSPDGTVQSLQGAIVKDAVGQYHADVLPTQVGLHIYEWEGTGVVQVASLGQFLVSQGLF